MSASVTAIRCFITVVSLTLACCAACAGAASPCMAEQMLSTELFTLSRPCMAWLSENMLFVAFST